MASNSEGREDGGHSLRHSRQPSESDLRGTRRRRLSVTTFRENSDISERSQLLGNWGDSIGRRTYATQPTTPRPRISRHTSEQHRGDTRGFPSRGPNFAQRLTNALSPFDTKHDYLDDRVWYDQFTSIDWVHDAQKDAHRLKDLRSRNDIRGKIRRFFDGGQGWVLVAIIGAVTAGAAFFVDITEPVLFDWKGGYCTDGFLKNKKRCCLGSKSEFCPLWKSWSEGIFGEDHLMGNYLIYVLFTVIYASLSCLLTFTTWTVLPGSLEITNLDDDLSNQQKPADGSGKAPKPPSKIPTTYYSAAGSGVAEVKVILSGFVLHGYLGFKTLIVKMFGLILSVASGMSLGKEGPFVHIATCIGNIACRLFSKYNHNDAKRREMLSASAASGVAVAFGAPIGGVLFSLEEVSYYFPSKTLFRTFFCCIVAALSLKFLNPYGTNKIVLFEVRYTTDWHAFELFIFGVLGVLGGVWGALFIKASKFWATRFRKSPWIKGQPLFEVVSVALVSGLFQYWNKYTKLAVTELLYEVASPCVQGSENSGLCPTPPDIPPVIAELAIAFAIKSVLTIITFGIKVPAGIYVPTMVIGGLMGHIIGLAVQYALYLYPESPIFAACPVGGNPGSCVVPGVYALVGAGAVMCGVTRLSVTLAVILFELTGSLDHVLPFSLAVLVSKWTADALEPLSIYDLLIELNSYPYMENKNRPIFEGSLADITPRPNPERIVDISESSQVPATELRHKLRNLQVSGELDGGLPIIRRGILVGLIPAPDLEFALDNLDREEDDYCLMAPKEYFSDGDSEEGQLVDKTDFTPFIDPAPLSIEICSQLDLVYECFVKLGLRYICVLNGGKFAGVVHKKVFVKYLKEQGHEH